MPTGKADKRSPAVSRGDVIAGKYRVGDQVASGGMGAIVRGRHEELGQDVAIKILHPEMGDDEELVERFLREARVAAQIDSEHVVRVYDVGRTKDGVPYMVMEYLTGFDLETIIRNSGELPIVEAVDHILQALNAVIEAHAAGIVHRDLKPANLFLARRPGRAPRVKVLDFGISKLPPGGDAAPSLTSTRSMLGSPGYMSPEQIVSTRDVDERSDLWSLGVILYELLTGEQAYTGQTLGQVFAKIRETDLPPVRELRPDVPVGLDRVIRKCLVRDRNERYDSAETLRDELAPFASIRTRTIVMADRRSHPGDLGSDPLAGIDEVPSTLIEGGPISGSGPTQQVIASDPLPSSSPDSAATSADGDDGDTISSGVPSEVAKTKHSINPLPPDEPAGQVTRQTVATWAQTASASRARGPLAVLLLLVVVGGAGAWWSLSPRFERPLAEVCVELSGRVEQRLSAAMGELPDTAPGADPSTAPSADPSTEPSVASSAEPSADPSAEPSTSASAKRQPPRTPRPPAPNPTAAPSGPKYDDLGI